MFVFKIFNNNKLPFDDYYIDKTVLKVRYKMSSLQ